MENEAFDTIGLQRPDRPEKEKEHRHRGGHVQIGIATAEQRARHMEPVLGLHAPANRSDTGNQAEPVGKENKDENRREEPKGLFDQVRPDDAFEKLVKTLDQPFPEALCARRHVLNFSRGAAREQNQPQGDNPGDHHRVGDKEFVAEKRLGFLRDAVLGLLRMAGNVDRPVRKPFCQLGLLSRRQALWRGEDDQGDQD